MLELYEKQIREGRYLLHEHPANSSSWHEMEMRKLVETPGVYVTQVDQCMFGLATRGRKTGAMVPARRRMRYATNAYHIAAELDKRCDGSHKHQPLTGATVQEGSNTPIGICRAICRGLVRELAKREDGVKAIAEISSVEADNRTVPDPNELHEKQEGGLLQISPALGGGGWDDVTGMPLGMPLIHIFKNKCKTTMNKYKM